LITYETNLDEKRRFRADDVKFVKRSPAKFSSSKDGISNTNPLSTAFAYLFCFGLALAVFLGRLPLAILGIYVAASAAAYVAYAMDKAASKRRGHRRIPEDTLHIWGLAGGWPGALLAQQKLRHKSSKTSFQFTFWVTVVLNCGALAWLLSKSGSALLQTITGLAR
jgi:uncharacterized membrane protein YsdA (DUF1294 family)